MRMSFTRVVGGWVSLPARNPAHADHPLPTLDRGDHLRPNETGQRAMGNAIDLDPF
jgi:hypothetical protein